MMAEFREKEREFRQLLVLGSVDKQLSYRAVEHLYPASSPTSRDASTNDSEDSDDDTDRMEEASRKRKRSKVGNPCRPDHVPHLDWEKIQEKVMSLLEFAKDNEENLKFFLGLLDLIPKWMDDWGSSGPPVERFYLFERVLSEIYKNALPQAKIRTKISEVLVANKRMSPRWLAFFSAFRIKAPDEEPEAKRPRRHNFGNPIRRAAKLWYTDQKVPPVEVLTEASRHGIRMTTWTHRDVIKVIHVHGQDPARKLVLSYLTLGNKVELELPEGEPLLETQMEEYQEVCGRIRVLNEIKSKELEDHERMRSLIEDNPWVRMSHVPTHWFRCPTVIPSLLDRMTVSEVLNWLQSLTIWRRFMNKKDSKVQNAELVKDAVQKKLMTVDQANRVLPEEILWTYIRYSASFGRIRKENRRNEKRKHVVRYAPDPWVSAILLEAYQSHLTQEGGVTRIQGSVLVAVDVNKKNLEEIVHGSRPIKGVQAAAALLLRVFYTADPAPILLAFSESDAGLAMEPLTLDGQPSFTRTVSKLKEVKEASSIHLEEPINWAINKKHHKVDCFVLVSFRRRPDEGKHLEKALNNYRTSYNPKAKVVLCLLHEKEPKCEELDGSLSVCGFDRFVPEVMARYINEKLL